MNILERCEDTDSLAIGGTQEFPTNTYYPPGTVCARNTYSQSCFFSGESGSPLMIINGSQSKERLYVEGFLSFIKGCSLMALSDKKGSAAR